MTNTNAYILAAEDIKNRSALAYGWYITLTDYKVYRTEDPGMYKVEEPNGIFLETLDTVISDLEMVAAAA